MNHNIPTATQSAEKSEGSSKEKVAKLLKVSTALGLSALALFGVSKGAEYAANVNESAAKDGIEQVMEQVPEASEGTLLGDTLTKTVRAKSGGLSSNIELAESINESHNALFIEGTASIDVPLENGLGSLVNESGTIPYTEDAVYGLEMARMHAEVSETSQDVSEGAAVVGAASGVAGLAVAGAAGVAAARDRRKQQ